MKFEDLKLLKETNEKNLIKLCGGMEYQPSDTTKNIRIIQLQIVRIETNECKISFRGRISTTYRGLDSEVPFIIN